MIALIIGLLFNTVSITGTIYSMIMGQFGYAVIWSIAFMLSFLFTILIHDDYTTTKMRGL